MEYERIKWACRRGMLELDLILEPYVLQHYPKASPEEQVLFISLLAQSDQDLFDWFMNKKPIQNPLFAKMIKILLDHANTQTP